MWILQNWSAKTSFFRFVLSESVRRDKEDRLKTIVTTEGVYFVRAKGVPSPESIVLLVRFSELYECQPLSSGKLLIELFHGTASLLKFYQTHKTHHWKEQTKFSKCTNFQSHRPKTREVPKMGKACPFSSSAIQNLRDTLVCDSDNWSTY